MKQGKNGTHKPTLMLRIKVIHLVSVQQHRTLT